MTEPTGHRIGHVSRETKETKLRVELDLDGPGPVEVATGVPFFDHMLAQLGKHGQLGLTVQAVGDIEIDAHHTVEDTSIALGAALREALGDKSGIQRFGDALVPLDEVLVRAAIDLSGRPYVVHDEPAAMSPMIGSYDTTLTRHIWESLAFSAGICLHVHVLYGRNPHHIVEAQFKAVARALRAAAARDPRAQGSVPSTKGVLLCPNDSALLACRSRPSSSWRLPRHSRLWRCAVPADVVVLDYGSGNLRSAERALARAGAVVQVTADMDAALNCDGLVVPGVGAYAACMAGIRRVGGDKVITQRIELGRPVLGICVGMQVLFSAGVEHGIRTEGCEVWPGTVDRLDAPVLPHMGWNSVVPPDGSVLFAGLDAGTRFYFVHSYALRMRDAGPLLALDLPASRPRVTVTAHGEPFAAAVEDGLVSATQFHPEKSGDAGATVLKNWRVFYSFHVKNRRE